MDIQALERQISAALADWTIPGGAVTILKDGETVPARGFGVKQAGTDTAVNAHTGFAIGSCTKSVTAVALAILVDEGRLAWDDPIIKHLPDFYLYDPWITQHVTVRDALAHRIGQRRNIRIYLKGDAPKTKIVHRMRYM
jgi:CubicO group peptidase (beta-lactamase class C family)